MADTKLASDIEPEAVEWLWRERIPRGMISVVAGRPDQGKGLFAVHVATEVAAAGGKVLYSAAEDSHSLMTVPRLTAGLESLVGVTDDEKATDAAVQATLDNILLWRFVLPEQFNELVEIVYDEEIDLIVIDPLASHLGRGVSRHSDKIRTILNPVTELLEATSASLLVIEHALKRVPKSGHPLDAIGGSGSGLPAASRTAFVFGRSPDQDDARVLAPAKFNVGPAPKALQFDLDVADIDVVGEVPFLVVDEELDAFDPMRLFESKLKPGPIGRPSDKRAAAAEWLTTYLATNGATLSSAIQEDAKQHGMSIKTLRRAADDMEIVKNPPGGGRNCTWDLPDDVKDMMGLPADEDENDDGDADGGISLEDGLNALLGGDDGDGS